MLRLLIIMALLLAGPAQARESVRSRAQLRAFARLNPCPSTHRHTIHCPGYILDHIVPLDCRGDDAPHNLQWQTIAEGKAKDRWERDLPQCRHRTHGRH